MKTLRRLLILFILSVIIALAFYFSTDDVVVSSWSTKIGEIAAIVIPVFVFVTIANYAILSLRTLFSKGNKAVGGIAKKSPPKKEGQNL